MDIETILMVVTAFISFIFGELAKKFNWIEKKYIPYQTLCIGIISGVLYYLFVDNSNIGSAIIMAFSSLIACGAYDLGKTRLKGE